MIVRKLEYLIALAREGHFERAAVACHVSQPTLSAAIRQLEIEMGVQIVKRGPRFHGLTEEGELVLAFAQRMASECEHLRKELADRGGETFATLRVGVIPAAVPLVPSLTIPFHTQHANVNLKIVDMNPVDILQGFEDYALDVGITYLDEEVRRYSRTHALYVETYVLLIHTGADYSGRTSASWTEAAHLPLCLLAPELQRPEALPAELFRHGGASSPRVETNSISTLYSHVRSGAWASVLPQSLAQIADQDREFEVIQLPKLGKPVSVGVMIPDRDLSLPLAEEFFQIAAATKIPWCQGKKK